MPVVFTSQHHQLHASMTPGLVTAWNKQTDGALCIFYYKKSTETFLEQMWEN
jgi:hypothetical protein